MLYCQRFRACILHGKNCINLGEVNISSIFVFYIICTDNKVRCRRTLEWKKIEDHWRHRDLCYWATRPCASHGRFARPSNRPTNKSDCTITPISLSFPPVSAVSCRFTIPAARSSSRIALETRPSSLLVYVAITSARVPPSFSTGSYQFQGCISALIQVTAAAETTRESESSLPLSFLPFILLLEKIHRA